MVIQTRVLLAYKGRLVSSPSLPRLHYCASFAVSHLLTRYSRLNTTVLHYPESSYFTLANQGQYYTSLKAHISHLLTRYSTALRWKFIFHTY